MDNEEKDLWHAYLQQGNHAMATRYANTQVHLTALTWTLWCCHHLYDCVLARMLYAVCCCDHQSGQTRAHCASAIISKDGHTSAVQAERDIVNRSEAEAAFEDDDFTRAASLWGRMRSSEPSFEEIALRFVEVGATEALQVFLMARLHVLGPDDKAQVQEPRSIKCKPALPALLINLPRKSVLPCN